MPTFVDEDLDLNTLPTDFWSGAAHAPHMIQGEGGMVYWRNCTKVALARKVKGVYKEERQCRTTGRGTLLKGHALFFWGDGGEAKED